MSPKVSVIIVTYNQRDTIRRAVESVLSQQRDVPFEIVIGDDGSTDGTRLICEQLASEHPDIIRLMPSGPNKGVVRNYFDCLKACRGEYVTDCAGDDYWTDPHKIERLASLLDTHPEATVAFSDWLIDDGENIRKGSDNPEVLSCDGTIHKGEKVLKLLLNHRTSLPYNLTASLYRRDIVMQGLSEPEQCICNPEFGCEDLPLMAYLASCGDAVGCDTATYNYSVSAGSIIGGDDELKLARFYTRALQCTATLADHYGIDRRELSDMFLHKADYIISLSFNTGDRTLLKTAIETVESWPVTLLLKTRLQIMIARTPLYTPARWIKRLLKRFSR